MMGQVFKEYIMRTILVGISVVALLWACGEDGDPSSVSGTGGTAAAPGGGAGGSAGTPGRPTGTPTNRAEECNNIDDDQDGRLDEGLGSRECSTACGTGNEVCQNGSWGGCDAPLEIEEICDSFDNDCDGQVDENLTQACDNPCGAGVRACVSGDWGECSAPMGSAEECNNQDDDCDGNIDENVFRDCQLDCNSGTEICENGAFGECNAGPVADEECGNGQDDDCDGSVDEGCGCVAGDTKPCSSDVGACSRGTQTCDDAGEWSLCVDEDGTAVVTPGSQVEDCNGIDDDCNGRVDDLMLGQECSTNEGVCVVGVLSCENGVRECVGGIEPSEETCDEQDNDCDGEIDENTIPAAESCDGRDNDCDGNVDEDVPPDPQEGNGNENCGSATVLGVIDEDNEDPVTINGQINGPNDTDTFTFGINETNLGGFGDMQGNITFEAGDENLDWQVCIRVVQQDNLVGGGIPDLDEVCESNQQCYDAVDGVFSLSHPICDRQLRPDDTRFVIRVTARNAMACAAFSITYDADSDLDLEVCQ